MRALVAMTVVGLLATVAGAPAAFAALQQGAQGDTTYGVEQPDVEFGDITLAVNADTPVYMVDINIPFNPATVSCPAVLDWNLNTDSDRVPLCDGTVAHPDMDHILLRRQVFGDHVADMEPSTEYDVGVDIRTPTPGSITNTGGPYLAVQTVTSPPAPVWVGIGDGFTSSVSQTTDPCTNATSGTVTVSSTGGLTSYSRDATHCRFSNDPEYSWITSAVSSLNGRYQSQFGDMTAAWEITGKIVADENASGTTLDQQFPALQQALRDHRGSWNWVGVSAGLQESGILTSLNNFYTSNPPSATSRAPWHLTPAQAASCPTYPSLATAQVNVGSARIAMQQAVVKTLEAPTPGAEATTGGDPNARVVQLLYPYIVEQSVNNGYTNPCMAAVKGAIDGLNAGVNLEPAGAPDDPHVFVTDLSKVFGNPVGTYTGGANGTLGAGQLQTKKRFGYPYPAIDGRNLAGDTVVKLVLDQASDLVAPTITPTPQRPANGNSWYKDPVLVDWLAEDPEPSAGMAGPNTGTTTFSTEGLNVPHESPRFCDLKGNCDTGSVDLSLDRGNPTASWSASPTANGFGWNNSAVSVTMLFTAPDKLSDGVHAGSGNGAVPTVLPVNGNTVAAGVTRTATLCDLADNCVTVTTDPIKVDVTPPTIGLPVYKDNANVTITRPANGWFNKPVTVTLTGADALSQIDTTAPRSATITQSFSGDGANQPVTASFYDKAGNSVASTLTVSVDQTKPTLSLTNGVGGALLEGTSAQSGTVITPTCEGRDDPALLSPASAASGVASCVLLNQTQVVTGTTALVTYTATVTDNAGNSFSRLVSYTVTGLPPVSTSLPGYMAGLGTIGSNVGVGFLLNCAGTGPNVLDVVWTQRFSLTKVDTASCTKVSGYDAGRPYNAFNTYTGTGTGKIGNATATIQWTFTDRGEPGTSDTGRIMIVSGGRTVLDLATTKVKFGNFEALPLTFAHDD